MEIVGQVVINAVATGSAYALIALALLLNHATNGFANFGLGAVFTASLYLFVLMSDAGTGTALAAIAAVFAAGVCGVLLELGVQRPARRRQVPVAAQMIGSLGLLIAGESAIGWLAGPQTRVAEVAARDAILQAGPFRIPVLHVITFAAAVLVTLLAHAAVHRTAAGRRFRAVSNDPLLANCFGISTHSVILGSTVASAMLLALAAILIGTDTGITPTMGFPILLIGLVTLFLGGITSVGGAFVAGLVIAVLQHTTALVFSGRWQDFVVFVVLVLVLRFRPVGIWGIRTRRGAVAP